MFTPDDGSIAQIAPDGVVVGAFYLPLPQAFNAYSAQVVVSPGRRYIAYSAYDSTAAERNYQLFVYDVPLGSLILGYDLSDAAFTGFDPATGFGFAPDSAAFDEANAQFAFGILRKDGLGWRVVVGDLTGGTEFTSLSSDSAGAMIAADAVPVVRAYDGQRVRFVMLPPTGAVSGQAYPAFAWNIGTGELTTDETFARPDAAHWPPTGERAVAVVREDGAAALRVTANGESFDVYATTDAALGAAHFIEDGARVLVEADAGGERALRVINRDGTLAGELRGTLDSVRGTPDGFLGTFDSAEGRALAYVNTTDSAYNPATLWTAGAGRAATLAFVAASGAPATGLGEWGRAE
jgi:hypothetical protein